jgi:hypothetical protein
VIEIRTVESQLTKLELCCLDTPSKLATSLSPILTQRLLYSNLDNRTERFSVDRRFSRLQRKQTEVIRRHYYRSEYLFPFQIFCTVRVRLPKLFRKYSIHGVSKDKIWEEATW